MRQRQTSFWFHVNFANWSSILAFGLSHVEKAPHSEAKKYRDENFRLEFCTCARTSCFSRDNLLVRQIETCQRNLHSYQQVFVENCVSVLLNSKGSFQDRKGLWLNDLFPLFDGPLLLSQHHDLLEVCLAFSKGKIAKASGNDCHLRVPFCTRSQPKSCSTPHQP